MQIIGHTKYSVIKFGSFFSSDPAAVYAVLQAIKDYERLTCLHFVKRTTEQDYIFFYPANG